MKRSLAYFATALLFYPPIALFARPIQKEDVHIKGSLDFNVYVNKDLTFQLDTTHCQTLLDDSDTALQAGTQVSWIDLGLGSLESIEAWTEFAGEKIPVANDQIHKGLAATSLQGFSDIEQYSISYSSVQKGARLCLHEVENTSTGLEGYFEWLLKSPFQITEKGSRFRVTSEVPLQLLQVDKRLQWQMKQSREGELYVYEAVAKEDILDGFMFEPFSNAYSPDSPFMILRSEGGLQTSPMRALVAKIDAKIQSGVLNQEAEAWVKQLKARRLSRNDTAQQIMAWVSDHIRYMGDWRSSEGRFLPRDVGKILSSGYGDCKDFSLLTLKLLEQAGVQARMALVWRGETLPYGGTIGLDQSLFANINHAVVYLEPTNAGEKGLIIDPTNSVSIAASLPDILDRKALVLAKPLQATRTPTWSESESLVQEFYKIGSKGNNVDVRCQQEYRGIAAVGRTMPHFRKSRQVNERALVEEFISDPISYKVHAMPEFSDRKVQPVKLDLEWEQVSKATKTPLGSVFSFYEPFHELMNLKVEPRVTSIVLGRYRLDSRIILDRGKPAHTLAGLDCKVESPWFKIERKVSQGNEGLLVHMSFETLRAEITPQEFLSETFAKVQADYHKCVRGRGLIVR